MSKENIVRLARTTAPEVSFTGGNSARFLYAADDNQRVEVDAPGPGCLLHLHFFTHIRRVSSDLRAIWHQHWQLRLEIDGDVLVEGSLQDWLEHKLPPFDSEPLRVLTTAGDLASFTSYAPMCFQRRLRLLSKPSPALTRTSIFNVSKGHHRLGVHLPGAKHYAGPGSTLIIASNCTELSGSAFDPRNRCSLGAQSICEAAGCWVPGLGCLLTNRDRSVLKGVPKECARVRLRECPCYGESGWYIHASWERFASPVPSWSLLRTWLRGEESAKVAVAGVHSCLRQAQHLSLQVQRLADDHAFDSVLFDEKAIASQSQTVLFRYRADRGGSRGAKNSNEAAQHAVTTLALLLTPEQCMSLRISLTFDDAPTPQMNSVPASHLFGCFERRTARPSLCASNVGNAHNVFVPELRQSYAAHTCHVRPRNAFSNRTRTSTVKPSESLDGVWHGYRQARVRTRSKLAIDADVAFSFLPMPFVHSVEVSVVTLQNITTSMRVAFNVTVERQQHLLDEQRWAGHLHIEFKNATADAFCTTNLTEVLSLPSGSAGKFAGLIAYSDVNMAHTEGNHYWAVDSAVTQLPNYRGTGFEDDFNLPWNAYMPGSNPNSHSFPFHGGIWQEGKGSMALYRFFILDPIQFHDGFHYWISQKENGIPSEEECRKDFRHSSSVAFYYMKTSKVQPRFLVVDTVRADDDARLRNASSCRMMQYRVDSTFWSSPDRNSWAGFARSLQGPCTLDLEMQLSEFNLGATLRLIFDAGATPPNTAAGGNPLQHAEVAINGTHVGRLQGSNGLNPMERFDRAELPIPRSLVEKGSSAKISITIPDGVVWTFLEVSILCLVHARGI